MHDINPDNACNELAPIFDKYWEENVRKNQKTQGVSRDGEKGEFKASEATNVSSS